MQTHYGEYIDYGNYESPCGGYESTACRCSSEKVLEEHTTNEWQYVSCKKCLKLKDSIESEHIKIEESIINQMADFNKFFEQESEG